VATNDDDGAGGGDTLGPDDEAISTSYMLVYGCLAAAQHTREAGREESKDRVGKRRNTREGTIRLIDAPCLVVAHSCASHMLRLQRAPRHAPKVAV